MSILGEAAFSEGDSDEVLNPTGACIFHCHRSPMLWRSVCFFVCLFKQTTKIKPLSYCNVLLPDTATDPLQSKAHYFVPRKEETQRLTMHKEGLFFISSRPHTVTLAVLGPRLDSAKYPGLSSTLGYFSEIVLPRANIRTNFCNSNQS